MRQTIIHSIPQQAVDTAVEDTDPRSYQEFAVLLAISGMRQATCVTAHALAVKQGQRPSGFSQQHAAHRRALLSGCPTLLEAEQGRVANFCDLSLGKHAPHFIADPLDPHVSEATDLQDAHLPMKQ